jgi:hypothetical protein
MAGEDNPKTFRKMFCQETEPPGLVLQFHDDKDARWNMKHYEERVHKSSGV